MRAFIALHPPPELEAERARLQREMEEVLPKNSVRWTPPEQIHLTLRFLGDIADEAAGDLENALQRACLGVAPFELRVRGAGCFPNARQPRIVWVGLEGGVESLQKLHGQIARETAAWGERDGRPFHPHLTMGRVKDPRSRDAAALGKILGDLPCPVLGAWRVEQVDLMQSRLSPQGAHHTRLAQIRLRPDAPAF